MKLKHIELSKLQRSPLNVRKHGRADVSDLVASIRVRGVLQPLLVREVGEGFDVIAGGRRLKACQTLAGEGLDSINLVPCAIMEEGDDAAAIEASLSENIDRLPMDEIDQYEAFITLRKKGRTVEEIARHFGVTARFVEQRLAIANLIPAILTLYRKEEIDGETLEALTLATKAQQKDWLAKFRDPDEYAPRGRQLRQWILGGDQIAVGAALFDASIYKGAIITDLFGEESYFADADAFWALQMAAVNERVAAYKDKGWADVILLDRGERWQSWDYAKVTRKQGGKVYVVLSSNGEVAFHEGFLAEKELRKKNASKSKSDVVAEVDAEKEDSAPALTGAARNYIALHRHAAVQASLIGQTGLLIRLMAAHAIAGSWLWSVKADAKRADKTETKASLEASKAEAALAAERTAILSLLEIDPESPNLIGAERDIAILLPRLIQCDDPTVQRILDFVMIESLSAGSDLIGMLGAMLPVGMSAWWQADEAFLTQIRDRASLHAMLADIGGISVAEAHKDSSAKVLRSVILQYATGEGRPKVEGWAPTMMRFEITSDSEPEKIAA